MENCAYLRKNPGYAPVVVIVFLPLSFDVFMLWGRDLFDKKP